MAASNEGEIQCWFYFKECPLAYECSKSAFAKVDADLDIANLKAKLSHHLRNSSLHKTYMETCDDELLESLVESAELLEHRERVRSEDSHPPPMKKQRGGDAGSSNDRSNRSIEKIVKDAIKSLVPGGPSSSGMNPIGARPLSDNVMEVYHKVGAVGKGGKCTLRATQLQSAVDCVGRAAAAASHAQRLAAQAAAAFGEEHANLCNVKDTLLAVLHER